MENVALDKTSKAQLSLILHYQTFLICVYSVQIQAQHTSTRRIFTIQTQQCSGVPHQRLFSVWERLENKQKTGQKQIIETSLRSAPATELGQDSMEQ